MLASNPDVAARLAAKLRAWHATIPPCSEYASATSCNQFSSTVFPGRGGGAAAVLGGQQGEERAEEGQRAVVWEDSEPDSWFDRSTGQQVSY